MNLPFKNAHQAPDIGSCTFPAETLPRGRGAKQATRGGPHLPQGQSRSSQRERRAAGILTGLGILNQRSGSKAGAKPEHATDPLGICEQADGAQPCRDRARGSAFLTRVSRGCRCGSAGRIPGVPALREQRVSDSARKHKIPRAMFFIQLPNFSYSRFPPPTKGLKEQRLVLAGLLRSLAREKISVQVRRLADTERSQLAELTTGTQAPVSPRIYRFTNQSDATCFRWNNTRGRMRRLEFAFHAAIGGGWKTAGGGRFRGCPPTPTRRSPCLSSGPEPGGSGNQVRPEPSANLEDLDGTPRRQK